MDDNIGIKSNKLIKFVYNEIFFLYTTNYEKSAVN